MTGLRKVQGSVKNIRRVESSPSTELVKKNSAKRPIYKPLVI
jgi:hypothetical protein